MLKDDGRQVMTKAHIAFGKASKKMCVYGQMSKKSSVYRSALINFFYYRQNRK